MSNYKVSIGFGQRLFTGLINLVDMKISMGLSESVTPTGWKISRVSKIHEVESWSTIWRFSM